MPQLELVVCVEVLQGALGVVELRLDVVACTPPNQFRSHGVFSLKPAPTTQPALWSSGPPVMVLDLGCRPVPPIVSRIDVMVGRHDLGRTPSLVNTQVAHDVGDLEAAVSTGTVGATEGSSERTAGPPARRPPTSCVLRGASAAIVAEKPLPNCAV